MLPEATQRREPTSLEHGVEMNMDPMMLFDEPDKERRNLRRGQENEPFLRAERQWQIGTPRFPE